MKPNKKYILDQLKNTNQKQKNELVCVLLPTALAALHNNSDSYHPNISKAIGKIKLRAIHGHRLSKQDVFKVLLVSDYPPSEVNHWHITGNKVWREKSNRIPKQITSRRRPSIRGYHGDVIPRVWLDKHLPHVRNQRDYDRHMLEKTGIDAVTADERRRGIIRVKKQVDK